jgi:pimeloyl-ACP methyl ester carboxylesterase
MRKLLFTSITILVCLCQGLNTWAQTPGEKASPEGYWEGSISREGKVWRVSLEIKRSADGLSASVDFPDVGGYARPFSVNYEAPGLYLERPQPGGRPIIFKGRVADDVISGEWSGLGVTASFSVKRTRKPEPTYREEEITFNNGNVTLHGTLLLPLSPGPHPALIFVHGSAAETRVTYKEPAMLFARRGVAALIYDKRGTGKSTGDWQTAGFSELAADALAGLRALKERKEINARQMGIVGHSQGGWIAPLAVTMSKDVAFIIVSAASALNAAEQSIFHRENVMREAGVSEQNIARASELRRRMYEATRTGASRAQIIEEIEKVHNEPWFTLSALPYPLSPDRQDAGMRELLFLDPIPVWEKVTVPVLVLWGERDIVVPVEKGRSLIEQALKRAGNKDYTIRLFPGIDHAITVAKAKEGAWDFPRRAPGYFESQIEWLLKRVDISASSRK